MVCAGWPASIDARHHATCLTVAPPVAKNGGSAGEPELSSVLMKSLQELDPVIEPEGDRCITLRYGDVFNAENSFLCFFTAPKIEQARLFGVLDVLQTFTTVAV